MLPLFVPVRVSAVFVAVNAIHDVVVQFNRSSVVLECFFCFGLK